MGMRRPSSQFHSRGRCEEKRCVKGCTYHGKHVNLPCDPGAVRLGLIQWNADELRHTLEPKPLRTRGGKRDERRWELQFKVNARCVDRELDFWVEYGGQPQENTVERFPVTTLFDPGYADTGFH